MNYLMLATNDTETQRQWEFITASRTVILTTAELVIFLESGCRALDLLQTTQTLEMVPAAALS